MTASIPVSIATGSDPDTGRRCRAVVLLPDDCRLADETLAEVSGWLQGEPLRLVPGRIHYPAWRRFLLPLVRQAHPDATTGLKLREISINFARRRARLLFTERPEVSAPLRSAPMPDASDLKGVEPFPLGDGAWCWSIRPEAISEAVPVRPPAVKPKASRKSSTRSQRSSLVQVKEGM